VLVRTPDSARLRDIIAASGGQVTPEADGALAVTGMEAPRVGELAAGAGIVLHELTPRLASLEEAFMELTADSVEYGRPAGRPAPVAAGQPDYTGRSAS
jgi:ABC-2 type transport system ATP-binding protein